MNIRENTLVTLANIASLLIFDTYDSNLINELINGLLYWSACYSDETINHISWVLNTWEDWEYVDTKDVLNQFHLITKNQ